jgi:sugar/nucleoside kinase (ribokinase family)
LRHCISFQKTIKVNLKREAGIKACRIGLFDITIVGHNVIDTIMEDDKQSTRPGGAVTYSSLAASWLGSRVAVLSKAGKDYPDDYIRLLTNHGVDTSMLVIDKGHPTTKLLLRYSWAGQREIKLIERCSPILPEDIPALLDSKIVHVGTVVNEVSPQTIAVLHRRCPFISIDLQGFVRSFSPEGFARAEPLETKDFLSKASIVNGSEEEVVKGLGLHSLAESANRVLSLGVGILIVTQEDRGSTIFSEGKQYFVPAYPVVAHHDPTGAGDSYMGAFLSEYAKGRSIRECGATASAAASLRVETGGSFQPFDSSQLRIRSRALLEEISERQFQP